MSAHETTVLHDAPRQRLEYAAERAASQMVRDFGWRRVVGDLPQSIGLRPPWKLTAWGSRVSIAVEEKSIRIVGTCSFELGSKTTRENVETVRKKVRQEVASQTDVSGR